MQCKKKEKEITFKKLLLKKRLLLEQISGSVALELMPYKVAVYVVICN